MASDAPQPKVAKPPPSNYVLERLGVPKEFHEEILRYPKGYLDHSLGCLYFIVIIPLSIVPFVAFLFLVLSRS